MIQTILIGIVVLFVAVLLMGVKVFFTKDGEFPNTHIGASKAMQDRNILCASDQDTQMRAKVNPVELILKSEHKK
ncbi:MAG: hypothetical protein BWZ06_00605 [Bacteroidetes bacterium ADurb.BinA261]|jgi:hypothetical protein|nr:hypothetical protein [Dysgonamonadaceae bacterium]OPZ14949.1 MAG: hypothetical protein BWZ06_00605 [Bacteroidetes bacterium ADurb.BinA261]